MRSSRVRHALEAVLAGLLFTLQNIVYGGWSISVMFIPLYAYVVSLTVSNPDLEREANLLLFDNEFIVGRVIALIGFSILLLAGLQLVRGYFKHVGLIKTGLYSVIRHPQYAGITIITLGLTIMVLTLVGNTSMPILMWLVQILGYIALARYEESRLEKKHKGDYEQYKRDVPFMIPVKSPFRIPETLFTVLVAIIVSFVLLVFPFNVIRSF